MDNNSLHYLIERAATKMDLAVLAKEKAFRIDKLTEARDVLNQAIELATQEEPVPHYRPVRRIGAC